MTELGFTTDRYLVSIEVPDDADPRDLPSPELLQRTVYHAVPCLTAGLASVEVADVTDVLAEAFANLRMARDQVEAVYGNLRASEIGGGLEIGAESLGQALADISQAMRFIEGREVPA
jgi:hypothetical protein